MKYLGQITLIFLFSFLGELFHILIPLPIPASIYGMLLLFLALSARIIKVESVKASGSFLTSILSILFVAPVVSLLDCWSYIRSHIAAVVIVFLVSTVIAFGVSGCVTQYLIRRKEAGRND